jgi:hypothetical protein
LISRIRIRIGFLIFDPGYHLFFSRNICCDAIL